MCEMENLSPYNIIKNLKEEVKRGKKDCQNEAIDLFKKIFKAIDFHTDFPSFTKGLNDLELKFSNLEAKLSTVTKERDNLLGTVDGLKSENKELQAKLTLNKQPNPFFSVPNMQETLGQGNPRPKLQKKDEDDDQLRSEIMQLNVDMLHKTNSIPFPTKPDRFSKIINEDENIDDGYPRIRMPRVSKGNNDQGKNEEHVENKFDPSESDEESMISKEDVSAEESTPLYDSDEYEINDVEPEVDIKEIEHAASDEDTSIANNITYLPIEYGNEIKNVNQDYKPDMAKMSDLEIDKKQAINKENKRFECEMCSYSGGRKDHLQKHREAVHEKIKKYKCEECTYSGAQKVHLKNHVDAVHAKAINYRCAICNYGTARKDRLDRHVDARHNIGDKKFKCGKCPYSSPQRAKLIKHVERNHDNSGSGTLSL